MRTIVLAAVLATVAVPAQAISRYNSESMSCRQAQAAVQSEGAVIFRYSSARNPSLTRYDRYVRHDGYCQWNEYAANAWIPTRDTDECFVRSCKPRGYGLGGRWRD